MSNEFIALKCVQRSIGDDNLTNMLETNIKTFYDYVLLSSLGAWTEVSLPTSGIYGADFSVLKMVDDPNYDAGQVWEGGRKDWVWETGVNYVDYNGVEQNPLPVGYPVVNGIPVTGGYHVNYPHGKVIFDSPVSESSSVRIPYSYRNIQLYKADDAPWWEEIQYNSYRLDSNDFSQTTSGDWSVFGENRVQLPAVVIEAVPRGGLNNRGYEIGSEALIAARDIKFHILAENRFDRNNLMDIFNLQSEYNIVLFNTNSVTANSDYPLDYRGMLTGTKMYPDLIVDHKFKHCRFVNSSISEVTQVHPGLYMASIRTTMEVVV